MATRAILTQQVGAEILPGDETDAIKAAVVALAAIITGGKLPVDIGSSLVNVDLAEVDVTALIAGIANGATQADILTKLSADPATETTQATLALETGGNLAAIATSVGIGSSMTSVAVNVDAGASQELIGTPGAGHELWIYGYELHANIGGTYQFLSAATAKTGIMPVAALGGVARDSSNPIFKCTDNEALNIKSVTCAADGIITYRDVTL